MTASLTDTMVRAGYVEQFDIHRYSLVLFTVLCWHQGSRAMHAVCSQLLTRRALPPGFEQHSGCSRASPLLRSPRTTVVEALMFSCTMRFNENISSTASQAFVDEVSSGSSQSTAAKVSASSAAGCVGRGYCSAQHLPAQLLGLIMVC